MALIISFEGTEGAGKGSCLTVFKSYLEKKNKTVHSFISPGATSLGLEIRNLLLHQYPDKNSLSELFLFLADRTELIEKKIKPLLNEDCIILLDRFHDSTFVYQGLLGEFSTAQIQTLLSTFSLLNLWPQLTFFIKTSSEILRKRCLEKQLDFMEKKHQVDQIQSYYEQFKEERIKTIDNSFSLEHSLKQMVEIYESHYSS